MKSYSESYKQAGVDITAGYKAVELMKKHIARTMTAGVCSLTEEGAQELMDDFVIKLRIARHLRTPEYFIPQISKSQ